MKTKKLENVITNRIVELCTLNNLYTNQLANLAGLPSSTIRCIYYGRSKNPGIRTILNLCQALDISIFDFFNHPSFKDKEIEGTY